MSNLSSIILKIIFIRTMAATKITVTVTDSAPYLKRFFLPLSGFSLTADSLFTLLSCVPSDFSALSSPSPPLTASEFLTSASSLSSAASGVSLISSPSLFKSMSFLLIIKSVPFFWDRVYDHLRFSSTLTVKNKKIKATLAKKKILERLKIPIVNSLYLLKNDSE